eukprot:scaffold132380_cov35-Prasinocladus_malaysianus.AAC.1
MSYPDRHLRAPIADPAGVRPQLPGHLVHHGLLYGRQIIGLIQFFPSAGRAGEVLYDLCLALGVLLARLSPYGVEEVLEGSARAGIGGPGGQGRRPRGPARRPPLVPGRIDGPGEIGMPKLVVTKCNVL